mmetsp:Transcript_40099/g.99382  ORF Transcript_40099/g.99382 Transcript_40099/m.99382 type:complete len:213 (+) Transcript_40099:291-929(+)
MKHGTLRRCTVLQPVLSNAPPQVVVPVAQLRARRLERGAVRAGDREGALCQPLLQLLVEAAEREALARHLADRAEREVVARVLGGGEGEVVADGGDEDLLELVEVLHVDGAHLGELRVLEAVVVPHLVGKQQRGEADALPGVGVELNIPKRDETLNVREADERCLRPHLRGGRDATDEIGHVGDERHAQPRQRSLGVARLRRLVRRAQRVQP